MKIGIDTSNMHLFSRSRGIGTYTKNLVEALKKYTDEKVILIDGPTDQDFDLIHYPYFDLFRKNLPFKKRFITVVTIHDVTPLVFPEHYPPGLRGRINFEFQKQSLKSVKSIMTDSESSKKDIIKFLRVPESKIFPVYSSYSPAFKRIKDSKKFQALKDKYNLPDKYAFYSGSVNWNKNLLNQTKACIDAGLDFVLVGNGFLNREELNHTELKSFKTFIEKYEHHPRVHTLGFIEQEDLILLINYSEMVLFASFYEGFGLPILEAQACGTPVITSDVSSMPEIAGSGALLVDPNSVNSIKEAIQKLMSDSKLKSDLVRKGLENIKRFSFEKMAREALNVYQQSIKE